MNFLYKLFTKWWFYVIILCVSIAIPFAINESYIFGRGYITIWGAEDVLSFYGDYLAFLGTVVLGFVAIFQNKEANKLNKKIQMMEQVKFLSMVTIDDLIVLTITPKQKKIINSKMPELESTLFILETPNTDITKYYSIDIRFKNNSEYPIINLKVSPKYNKQISKNAIYSAQNDIYLPSNDTIELRILLPLEHINKLNTSEYTLLLEFENIFGFTTNATLNLTNLRQAYKMSEYQFRLNKISDIKSVDN